MKGQAPRNNIIDNGNKLTSKMPISARFTEAPEVTRVETLLAKINHRHHKSSASAIDSSSYKQSLSISQMNSSVPEYTRANTIDCRNSSKHPSASQSAATSLLQRMYIMTRRVQRVSVDEPTAKISRNVDIHRFTRRPKASYISEGLLRPSFICLLALMTLTSCFYTVQAAESIASSEGQSTIAKANLGPDNIKNHPNDRIDTVTSKPDSTRPTPAEKSEKSIVASLSSAVASAAAAAAVAAAQNSLSSSDARSLVSGPHHRHHSQTQRSPGLNLAIKLVDTIPEVPYNILHNMKKLDHAAPFYNVPNKLSGGNTKESKQNFLSSALSASGSLGGAAEQLSALFRSPMWKRIADGYGEFTSEFRSRFRAPGATPMKGSPSSPSERVRDVSLPALLMLVASSMSGADWRPVRTRRKSFIPVDIPNANLGANPAFSSVLADMKAAQYQHQPKPSMDSIIGEGATGVSWLDQSASRLQYSSPQMQQAESNQIVRVNDANLQPGPSVDTNTWTAQQQQVGGSAAVEPQTLALTNGGQDQNQHYFGYQPATAAFQQQSAVKRSDEIIATDGHSSYTAGKPTSSNQERTSLFSSLTSDLALGQAKLMSKLFDANVGDDGNSYRMMSLADGIRNQMLTPIRRAGGNQLSDKQRYSLVDSAGHGADSMSPDGSANEQKLSPSSTKPFSLSAMARAVTSMIGAPVQQDQQQQASESGSSAASRAGFFSRANLQHLIGDKTINHEETLIRRQPAVDRAAEQRDLTKLLPESWREVVKRTMSTVQQQANVQWKSIEGQLANWVQDKLKVTASGASASPSVASASSSGANTPPAPVANILASMSSTALNILGLHKNSNSSNHSADHHASSTAKVDKVASSADSNDTTSVNQRGKLEKKPSSATQQPSRGALANVASVIVKSLTNRQSTPGSSSSASSSSSVAKSSPLSPPTPSTAIAATSSSVSNGSLLKAQSQTADDAPVSSSGSVTSKYSTLTGAQPEPEKSPASSALSASASGQVNVNNAND